MSANSDDPMHKETVDALVAEYRRLLKVMPKEELHKSLRKAGFKFDDEPPFITDDGHLDQFDQPVFITPLKHWKHA
jgi:hypothetical protein